MISGTEEPEECNAGVCLPILLAAFWNFVTLWFYVV
jgi:hypothetical protein